jgi:general secretion pathway protein G
MRAKRLSPALISIFVASTSTVLVISFTGTTAHSPGDRTAAILSTVDVSLELYRLHLGKCPANLEDLLVQPQNTANASDWRGPYVRDSSCLADEWGNGFVYRFPGTHNADWYDLWSLGPDGVSGTTDDITNWD